MKRAACICALAGLVLAYLGTAALLLQASMFQVLPGPHPVTIGLQSSHTKDPSSVSILERRFVPLVKGFPIAPALATDISPYRPLIHPTPLPAPPDETPPAGSLQTHAASRAPPAHFRHA